METKTSLDRFLTILNSLGSIASISGITALWMNEKLPNVTILPRLPFILGVVLIGLGVCALLVYGYIELLAYFKKDWVKGLYFPVATIFLGLLVLVICVVGVVTWTCISIILSVQT